MKQIQGGKGGSRNYLSAEHPIVDITGHLAGAMPAPSASVGFHMFAKPGNVVHPLGASSAVFTAEGAPKQMNKKTLSLFTTGSSTSDDDAAVITARSSEAPWTGQGEWQENGADAANSMTSTSLRSPIRLFANTPDTTLSIEDRGCGPRDSRGCGPRDGVTLAIEDRGCGPRDSRGCGPRNDTQETEGAAATEAGALQRERADRLAKWWAGPTMHSPYDATGLARSPCCCFEPTVNGHPEGTTWFEATQLAEDEEGLLIDPGAFDNLVGEYWLERVAQLAKRHGKKVSLGPLSRPISVEGVGEKSSVAQREAIVPGTVVDETSVAHTCEYRAPVVEASPIPALLGNRSLHNLRAILDMVNDRLYLCGDGDVQFTPPPGSHVFKLRPSRSGHLLLPFTQYSRVNGGNNASQLMFPWTSDNMGTTSTVCCDYGVSPPSVPTPVPIETVLTTRNVSK